MSMRSMPCPDPRPGFQYGCRVTAGAAAKTAYSLDWIWASESIAVKVARLSKQTNGQDNCTSAGLVPARSQEPMRLTGSRLMNIGL